MSHSELASMETWLDFSPLALPVRTDNRAEVAKPSGGSHRRRYSSYNYKKVKLRYIIVRSKA